MPGRHDPITRWPALDTAARRSRLSDGFTFSPGPLAAAVVADTSAAGRAAAGLWRRDPSTWSDDPTVQRTITNRLGWLSSPLLMADALPRIEAFADSIKRQGFTDVVLLGMGGSSLAPEVLRAVVGVAPGWPRFHMLDSTDPSAVRATSTPPATTLFVLASKSGTTIEPNVLAAHFRSVLEGAHVPHWADHFVAITDEGTALAARARDERFRDTFLNPGDIGGRYSALSFFGLVPAALMGQDAGAIVGWGLAMLAAAESADTSPSTNPATALGLLVGAAARAGRDKLTLILPPALEPFGLWVEQLVAESTGKQGSGIVPIAGETPGDPSVYGTDRLFVGVRMHASAPDAETHDAILDRLRAANAPTAAIELPEAAALGAEFVRWEIATAIAGALLRVNPFDEPNVQQAKDATRALLDRYASQRRLPVPPPDATTPDGVALTLSAAARTALSDGKPQATLSLLRERDYLVLLAYLGPDLDLARSLRDLRMAVRDRTRAATMLGYGPRYLHSTGQLHKGGPNTGVFVLVTASPPEDLPIPDQPFSLGTLELAQALGDFASLDSAGRRVLHVHLPSPDHRLLRRVADMLLERWPSRPA